MINGECSDSVDISIGSPQGSVLLPILFACFINNVGDHVYLIVGFIFMLTIFKFILWLGAGT
jgi:hypothetical protein